MNSNRRRLAARRKKESTGLPIDGEPVFIAVAKLRRPHGLRGEALVAILSDFPERISPETILYLGEDHIPITIKSRRKHNDGLLLTFEELPAKQNIDGLQNKLLYVRAEDLPVLEEGEFYHHELIGMAVKDEQGKALGTLEEILLTGANDVYLVRSPEGKEILLPATSEVIRDIDREEQLLTVRIIPGLIDQ